MRHLVLPLVVAGLLAGCAPSATQPSPSGSTAPSTSPSAAPSTGTPGAAAGFFGAGRSWDYDMKTMAAGVTTTGSIKIEVSAVTGDQATLKTTSTVAGVSTSNTQTVKVNDQNAFANVGAKGAASPVLAGTESVTVAAGTFTAKKYTATSSENGGTGTVTYWLVDDIGMVKETVETSTSAAGMTFKTNTTLELKSYKK